MCFTNDTLIKIAKTKENNGGEVKDECTIRPCVGNEFNVRLKEMRR